MIWYTLTMVVVLGLTMGSFLNCLAWRIYHDESLWGRSKCPKCHKTLKWYDNVPVFGWLRLKGKCRFCNGKISPQYVFMELLVGALFLLVFLLNIKFDLSYINTLFLADTFNWHWFGELLRDWFLLSSLIVIFIMDFDWFVIADEVSLTAAAVMGLTNLYFGVPWQSLLLGAAVGAGFFLLQYVISKGSWIGGGDIRMGLLMGLALGWPNVAVGLMLGYFIGALWGVGLIISGKKKVDWTRPFKPATDDALAESALPFGTFLAIGTLIAYYWGAQIINWYFGLLF